MNAMGDICPPHGVYPTSQQFYQGWGRSAVALYIISSIVFIFNLILFLILIYKFLREVNRHHVPYLIWITSIFTFIAFITFLMLVLPKATEFLRYVYRIYESIVILKFVDLSVRWYGDEESLMECLGKEPMMQFNVPPCCCWFCFRNVSVTRNKLMFIRFLTKHQVAMQTFTIFMQLVLNYNGIHQDGLAYGNPHTFLFIMGKISQILGLYGLFLFFHLKRTFNILEGFMYTQKFFIMKGTLMVFIQQDVWINILITNDVITCYNSIGPSAVGNIINCSLLLFWTSLLGILSFVMYIKYPTFKGENTVQWESKLIENNKHVACYSLNSGTFNSPTF